MKAARILWREFQRQRYRLALKSGKPIPLSFAKNLWKLSNEIYVGPVGPSAKILPEFALFERIAKEESIEDGQLLELVGDDHPAVAGYGLELLIRRDSGKLSEALDKLRHREEEVSMEMGCIMNFMPLCEYAEARINASKNS